MKILIIGLGSIAKKHINALRSLDLKVEFFAFRSSENAVNFDEVKNLYSWDTIDIKRFDFILLSNPTSLHHDLLEKLQDFEIPLFIEKPLFAETSEEAEKLVENYTKSNRITYVGCNMRFLNCLQKVKELLPNEHINEVNSYSGSYLPDWRPSQDFRKVYSSHPEMGGGVHLDLIHELDYTYWIFGEPIRVDKLLRNKSHLNIEAIDYANYRLEYGTFCSSIILNYYRKSPKRSLEIICESGTYTIDILRNKICFEGKEIYISEQKFIDTYKDQMRFFIDKIMSKKEKFNTVNEAYKILDLCLN